MGLKIIDFINLKPMALSKVPKTFGLSESKKRYFTHFFNSPDNLNYVGNFLSASFYGAEFMSVDQKELEEY